MLVAGTWLLTLTGATVLNWRFIQFWDYQIQTLFFEVRGPVVAPADIVILTIDDESMAQAEYYTADPAQYAELEPIQRWPWKREAYAIAIAKLLEAGARVVALDILFTSESTYGPADDQALAQVLQQYGDRVVLGATYGTSAMAQGNLLKPTLPLPQFLQTPVHTGIIQFPIEANGRIHRQSSEYLKDLATANADLDETSQIDSELTASRSFAATVAQIAGVELPPSQGNHLYYYGPNRTFEHIPFWYVLDPDPWNRALASGAYFQDKIVLIGASAGTLQDLWRTPFAETLFHPAAMPGVEIIATDIATLRSGNALQEGIPSSWMRGGLVLLLGIGFSWLLRHRKRPTHRLALTALGGSSWLGLSYVLFAQGGILLPTAMPVLTFATIGGAYIVTDIVTEQIRKQRLRNTLAQYVTSPIVQEIISQQDDFRDLLRLREEEVIGLLLEGRYQIVKLLGSGGFGETYVARDTQRPGSPSCVVKELKIISDDPEAHRLARRLFVNEAETLERLGHHDQIPRLLAYFEANYSFYLVEEMIEGRLLRDELASRKPRPQLYALDLLKDLLPTVSFVHHQGVIHRDIKPSNLIRRYADRRLVLIDFGAVKQISNRLTDTHAQITSTIGIGTQGYMPSEQSAGLPRFNSDLYAVGITAIEALTGIPPYALRRSSSGEILWRHEAPGLDPRFGDLIARMVRYDFSKRYQTSEEVLQDLLEIEPILRANAQPGDEEAAIAESLDLPEDDEEPDDSSTQVLPSGWMDEK